MGEVTLGAKCFEIGAIAVAGVLVEVGNGQGVPPGMSWHIAPLAGFFVGNVLVKLVMPWVWLIRKQSIGKVFDRLTEGGGKGDRILGTATE